MNNLTQELPHLLKLLDDEQPEIKNALIKQLAQVKGDLSHEMAALNIDLSKKDQSLLSDLLFPGRERQLIKEWHIPQNSLELPDGDWETFEFLLRQLSDFLHDGITLRASLSDLLDDLADEAQDKYPVLNAQILAEYLFQSKKFIGNSQNYYFINNSDLTWCLENNTSNPIGLAVILMLVGQRLGVEIYGCNFPGHFFARAEVNGRAALIDPFRKGVILYINEIIEKNNNLDEHTRRILHEPCSQKEILRRILHNLGNSYTRVNHEKGERLTSKLLKSLV